MDIHFWGSWWHDNVGTIDHFVICVAENIPAEQNPHGDWSIPGETIVEWEIYDWVERGPYFGNQGWYWCYSPQWDPNDHQRYWQYNVFLDESQWIWQEEGEIYWLCISAIVEEQYPEALWGWKSTSEDLHFMDDAVWGIWYYLDWLPLTYPSGLTMDLAFVITGFNPDTCDPDVVVKKYVLDPNGNWIIPSSPDDALDVTIGSTVKFKITMDNVGNAPISGNYDDEMEDGLKYKSANPPPTSVVHDPPYWRMTWENLELDPDGTDEIIVEAEVVGEHCKIYYQKEKHIHYCTCGFPACDCPPWTDEHYVYVHAIKKGRARAANVPFFNFLENQPNLFPLLRLLLLRLGL